jgi:hypothetical protein
LKDFTNDANVGEEVFVAKSSRTGGIYWWDDQTLHWGDSSGPAEDKSLVWEYLGEGEVLVDPLQVPIYIPYRHRYLLVWQAAVLARLDVDEDSVPQNWLRKADELLTDYIMDLSQGRLRFTVPPRQEGTFSSTSGVTL